MVKNDFSLAGTSQQNAWCKQTKCTFFRKCALKNAPIPQNKYPYQVSRIGPGHFIWKLALQVLLCAFLLIMKHSVKKCSERSHKSIRKSFFLSICGEEDLAEKVKDFPICVTNLSRNIRRKT